MIYESTRKATREELLEKIKELESDNYECNNIIDRYMEELELKDKMIDLMSEHLTTPIHSKKDVVEYFENLAKVNLQSNKENVDTEDFKQKYQCLWNLKSNKESGDENAN